MKIQQVKREFIFKGKALEDPNPKMTVDQVRSFYAAEMPELVNVTWKESQSGSTNKIEFIGAVGSKA